MNPAATLANMQTDFHPPAIPAEPEAAPSPRSRRFALRSMAGRILSATNERVRKCGHKLVGSEALICIGNGGAYVSGVETCGSVWACPVCAAKIAEGRRADVAQCLDGHVMAGGDVYMSLFTIPHVYSEGCRALRTDIAKAWTSFIQGKAWTKARKRFGIIGYIRALEVTHGGNGWHPHLHCLFLTNRLDQGAQDAMRVWVGERWAGIVERMMGKAVNLAKGFGFQRACNLSAAGDYVVKGNVDSELTKANHKLSKKGGRSPFQLLACAEDGDHLARMLFREYALAFKGARHVTWSLGLRDLYIPERELTDEELAAQLMPNSGDFQVMALHRFTWSKIVRAKLIPELLTAAEQAGRSGIFEFLRGRGLALEKGIAPNVKCSGWRTNQLTELG